MKNNATNSPVLTLVYGAAIAAIYVVLTMVFLPISFGPIQFRISELLCVLPYFTPAAIPGLFIGCLLANFLGGAAALDVIFGSIATLIGAVGSYLLRKNRYLVSVPPILANMIIVPWVLRFAYGSEDMIWFFHDHSRNRRDPGYRPSWSDPVIRSDPVSAMLIFWQKACSCKN